jgi:acetyltransferase-like isoleucine patch superfamily enzyme
MTIVKLYDWVFNLFPTIVRSSFYSFILDSSTGIKVYGKVKLINPNNLKIGAGSTLNEGVYINSTGGVHLGNKVRVSAGAKIISIGLDSESNHIMKSVSIGDGCWLGANSIVLPGVYLANNTTVAAGALVTKSVYTENTTIVGVPARKIKD